MDDISVLVGVPRNGNDILLQVDPIPGVEGVYFDPKDFSLLNVKHGIVDGRFSLLNKKRMSGSFGEVAIAKDLELGDHVALKAPIENGSTFRRSAEFIGREAEVLSELKGTKNIVNSRGAYQVDGFPILAMDFLEFDFEDLVEGCLSNPILCNNGSRFGLIEDLLLFQILPTFDFLASKNVSYVDFKLGNLRYSSDLSGLIPKMVDFGSVLVDSKSSVLGDKLIFTPNYVAPEILRGSPPPTPVADVYSFGRVMLSYMLRRAEANGHDYFSISIDHYFLANNYSNIQIMLEERNKAEVGELYEFNHKHWKQHGKPLWPMELIDFVSACLYEVEDRPSAGLLYQRLSRINPVNGLVNNNLH